MEKIKNYLKQRRHRKILSKINLSKDGDVLDISCGDGKFLAEIHKISPQLSLYGLDISETAINGAKNNCPEAHFFTGDSSKLERFSEDFDRVFCVVTMHHYMNPKQVFLEVSKTLSRDGVFYIVDAFPKYRITQKIYNYLGCPEPYHFEKYYLEREVVSLAEKTGFIFKENIKINTFPKLRVLVFEKV